MQLKKTSLYRQYQRNCLVRFRKICDKQAVMKRNMEQCYNSDNLQKDNLLISAGHVDVKGSPSWYNIVQGI